MASRRRGVHAFELGPIRVQVSDVGEGVPPWGERHEPVYQYRVVVTDGHGNRYASNAWGSIADHEKQRKDYDGIGELVVDELLSANADPDEFVNMVVGDKRGREALSAGREAEKVTRAAGKFKYDELTQAVEIAREREEGRYRGGRDPRRKTRRDVRGTPAGARQYKARIDAMLRKHSPRGAARSSSGPRQRRSY